jgi:dihydroorotate dehydrogenase (fumarate)
MANLDTKYMGLDIKNPLIVASSSLTGTVDKCKKCEDSGAGAVVLKSIFEEQIISEADKHYKSSETSYHPEALDYINRAVSYHSRSQYLELIRGAKEALSLPVIASINCVSRENWVDYAKEIEDAGPDGLELNLFVIRKDLKTDGSLIEKIYFDVIDEIKNRVGLPIALKISPFFSNLFHMADQFEAKEISALVLFNRFYHFLIDIDKFELKRGKLLTSAEEMALTLRWISLLSGRFDYDLAATTGIHDANGVIQQLLAGATAVQIASTLFINGIGKLDEIVKDIEKWMKKHDFDSVGDFRGRLSQEKSENPTAYERFQYIKSIVGVE